MPNIISKNKDVLEKKAGALLDLLEQLGIKSAGYNYMSDVYPGDEPINYLITYVQRQREVYED